jgi:hypothetical protein
MVYRRGTLNVVFLGLATCGPSAGPPPAALPSPAETPVASRPGSDAGPRAPLRPDPAVVHSGPEFSAGELQLWERRVRPRLARDLWRNAGRYDAATLFMLPLHAAFERNYPEGQQQFAEHIAQFTAQRDSVRLDPDAQLSWLQYLYFVSRFIVLAADHGHPDMIPPELPVALHGWVAELWLRSPAWQWFRKPFPGGFRQRVDWKLSNAPGPGGKAFEHAILDQELFLFAIAADLRHYGRTIGSPLAQDPVLNEVDRFARRVYDARVVWNADSGWTFQPGVWRDHEHHLYDCRTEKRPGLERCDKVGGSEDVSHTHRFPLWIRSSMEAAPADSGERKYYERLQSGLERQFFDRVLVSPSPEFSGYRLRNYMDGENGIYRWGYRTLGRDQGYGPYELSSALLLSWWGFLPGPRARELFRQVAGEFPLSDQLLQLYRGPIPAGRQPGKPPAYLVDGTSELLSRLAAELP